MTTAHHTIAIGGIDTDAGKSIATGLLASHLLAQGKTVTTLKLVQTGCTGIAEDIQQHRRLMGQQLTELDRDGTTCPYVFPFPASPSLAARMTSQAIDAGVLDQAMARLRLGHQCRATGAGILQPLTKRDVTMTTERCRWPAWPPHQKSSF